MHIFTALMEFYGFNIRYFMRQFVDREKKLTCLECVNDTEKCGQPVTVTGKCLKNQENN